MFRSARHRSPMTPRWVRGLIAGASLVVIATSHVGCGIDYVFREISPLHVTGWSFAFPILPAQQQRLEEDMNREERNNKVPILDPIPGDFAPAACLDPRDPALQHKRQFSCQLRRLCCGKRRVVLTHLREPFGFQIVRFHILGVESSCLVECRENLVVVPRVV